MSIATLSGWGQPHDALHAIAPHALHIDYAAQPDAESALALIAAQAAGAHTLIGWSMGGQLAVRAVAERRVAPRRLVLIASPYQFVQNPKLAIGLGHHTYTQYRYNMEHTPTRAFQKSYALIAHGDENAATISPFLLEMKQRLLPHNWLYWLDAMAGYSCRTLDFAHFPPTLLVHGEKDAVIAPEQSHAFCRAIPHARLALLPGCGHAPHWHDAPALRRLIAEFTA